jgi:hypothetical protein
LPTDQQPIQSIYRKNALDYLETMNEMQSALTIVKPGAWVLMACFGCLLTALLGWGIMGKIEITVPALGIIVASSELKQAEELLAENIAEHQDKLKALSELFSKQRKLYHDHYLTVNELEKGRQDYLTAKDELAALTHENVITLFRPLFGVNPKASAESLEVLLFVNHDAGKKVSVGMDVYILPSTLSPFEYGYLRGQVTNVSHSPVNKDIVNSYIGNVNLVDEFFNGSAPFLVKVRLIPDQHTPSMLAWTTGQGATFKIEAGTTVSAKIVNRISSPFALLAARI